MAETNLLEWAMTIICNAGGGNWKTQSQDWQSAARRWLDEYNASPQTSGLTRVTREVEKPSMGEHIFSYPKVVFHGGVALAQRFPWNSLPQFPPGTLVLDVKTPAEPAQPKPTTVDRRTPSRPHP